MSILRRAVDLKENTDEPGISCGVRNLKITQKRDEEMSKGHKSHPAPQWRRLRRQEEMLRGILIYILKQKKTLVENMVKFK